MIHTKPTSQHRIWPRGLTAKHARTAGLSYRHFVGILERRRQVTPTLAARLANITGIPLDDWLDPRYARHPIFRGPVLVKPMREFWQHGGICATAIQVGIGQALLSDIVYRRRRVEPRLALKLQTATGVSALEWATNRISKHPAFFGAPWTQY